MTDLRWPADRFFWAVLEAPGVKAQRGLPEGLKVLFQEELPVPIEEVHAVGVAAGDGRVVVCAARREDLATLPDEALRLAPECMPDSINSTIDPTSLNLLVGDFEPKPLRRERGRRRMLLVTIAACVACLAAVGLSRRARAWDKAGQDARVAVLAVGSSPLALRSELDRLRQAPRPDAKAVTVPDASVALAALLSAWPSELECQTESVQVSPTTMTLSLTVAHDPRPFLSALRPPEGWTLNEPRLTSTADGSHLQMVLRRKEAKP